MLPLHGARLTFSSSFRCLCAVVAPTYLAYKHARRAISSNLTLYKAVDESKSATLSPFVCQSGAMLSTNGPQWSLSNCHQAAILLRLPQTLCQLPKTAYRNNHVNGDNLLLLTSTHTPTRTLTGPLPPSEGPSITQLRTNPSLLSYSCGRLLEPCEKRRHDIHFCTHV